MRFAAIVTSAVVQLSVVCPGWAARGPVPVASVPDEPRLPEAQAALVSARINQEAKARSIVGISVALVRNGEIVHVEHAGWEDREKQVPAGPETMYRWGSISKPLTAVAAMQLWELGRLDLDADVRLLVPEFPRQQQTITTRQILCHQGGIVHYLNGRVIKTPRPELEGRYFSIIDALDTFKASPLVCEPGSKYSYTTHGYILAGAVVERACGEPARTYPEQVRQRIITPLGMATLRPDYQWEVIPHRAVGYRPGKRDENGTRAMVVSTDTDVSWKLAGGGWISNVQDLALFGAGMLGHKLVKPGTRDLMWSPQTTADGKETPYGLGFQIEESPYGRLVRHGGSQEKCRTLLLMLPGQDACVAIMCNTEGTDLSGLGRDLLGLIVDAGRGGEPIVPETPAAAE